MLSLKLLTVPPGRDLFLIDDPSLSEGFNQEMMDMDTQLRRPVPGDRGLLLTANYRSWHKTRSLIDTCSEAVAACPKPEGGGVRKTARKNVSRKQPRTKLFLDLKWR